MSLWDYMIFDKIVETGSLREAADALPKNPSLSTIDRRTKHTTSVSRFIAYRAP